MSRAVFSVTYEIVTEESAADGEAEERGFICEAATLRDALTDLFRTRTNRVDSGQGLDCSIGILTMMNGMEYETGAYETRALHMPRNVTGATYNRIARLARAHR